MANWKDLTGLVLIFLFVGMLVGVGVLIMDGFSDAARNDAVVLDENVSLTGGSGTVTNTFIRSLESCIVYATGNDTYWTLTTGSDSSGALCVFNEFGQISVNDSGYFMAEIDYTAGIASASSTSVDAGGSAVGSIANDWLSLIVTISILAIILGLVLVSFAPMKR